jgi:hypothetical protein
MASGTQSRKASVAAAAAVIVADNPRRGPGGTR